MIQPRPLTFWRFVLGVLSLLSLLAFQDLFDLSRKLGIVLAGSRTWLGLFAALGILTLFVLSLLVLSFTARRDRLVQSIELLVDKDGSNQVFGGLLLLAGLAGFGIFTCIPDLFRTFGSQPAIRYLIFFIFSLAGTWGIRLLRRDTPWMTAFLSMILVQSVIQLVLVYSAAVTAYPFARGWSETSRFYFPSLFFSELVYGQEYPWPILHPTLHLLLAPPYPVDAPLWFHRFWQVALRFLLAGMIVPPLLHRLSLPDRSVRWLVGLWMFLFLFMGPVYFHLAVPVIIVLAGFSVQNERRTWAAVLLASLWCGWSRVNWYAVPGMIAAVLYLLE